MQQEEGNGDQYHTANVPHNRNVGSVILVAELEQLGKRFFPRFHDEEIEILQQQQTSWQRGTKGSSDGWN